MALLNLVYRDQLFPREAFRDAWEGCLPPGPLALACRTMVGLLALAHDRACEAELAGDCGRSSTPGSCLICSPCSDRFAPASIAVPEVTVTLPAAIAYDVLLSAPQEWAARHEPRSRSTPPGCRCCCNELRLPAIARLWPEFSERADKESWPAARFLSALAELEIAERGQPTHPSEIWPRRACPPGKTLDNFDFAIVPMLSKARVMALAAGDTWLDKATNLLLFGPPGAGKSHCASAIGRALVENGYRVLFTRTTDFVQRLQAARQALCSSKPPSPSSTNTIC